MKVSYYPGCSMSGTAREYGESLESVSKTLGVELKQLPDWTCCGSSSAHVSDDDLAIALSARNLLIAQRAGMDVMVPCAMCYGRFKVAEKELLKGRRVEGINGEYKGSIQIKPAHEFFWQKLGEDVLKQKVKKSLEGLNPVCYYGCLTARPPEVTDCPNPENPMDIDRLMKALGAKVKPWSYKTDCCGGSLILTRPDIAKKLIQKILDMAQESGADCIVAACPMCQMNLDSRQREIAKETGKDYEIPVFFFTELMGLAFNDLSVKKWLGRHEVDASPLLKQKGLI
jgi:heterodisulfide reductase subunit B